MGKHYKTIRHCWFLHTLYKRIGYVIIIPKPHFSSRECINSHCRRFDVLLFAVLAQYVAAMIAVDRSCSCRSGWSLAIDRPWLALRPFHSTDTCSRVGLRDSFWVFFAYKKFSAEPRRVLARGCTVSRYEQFDTSPETIEQELRPAICEQRQT